MATGYVDLFPGGVATDGSGSGNTAATLAYEVSAAAQTANTPKVTQYKLLLDASTDEHWTVSGMWPGDYSSGGTIRGVIKFTSATSGDAILKAGQVTSVNSSTDDDALAYAAADVSSAVTAPATQGQPIEFTISLTTTNMAANRKFCLFLGRDADNASDTATGDVELLAARLEYTTT